MKFNQEKKFGIVFQSEQKSAIMKTIYIVGILVLGTWLGLILGTPVYESGQEARGQSVKLL